MVLHHIGIVVDHLNEAIPIFEVWMNARRIGSVVEDETQGARIQLFLIGTDSLLELIEPLPGRDPAMHHVGEYHLCFTVPDLDAEMHRLHALGAMTTSPPIPSTLFGHRPIAFLATHSGQLLELLEEAKTPVQ